MGRYLHGTANFVFKYEVARQPSNLVELPSYLRVGRGSLVPELVAIRKMGRLSNQILATFPCMPLLRQMGCRGGELLPGEGDVLAMDTLEPLQRVLADNALDLVLRLDELLAEVPTRVILEAHRRFAIERNEWSAALQRINRRLAAPLDLENLGARFTQAAAELRDTDHYLPLMALFILNHAAAHDLDLMEVREEDEPLVATGLWDVVAHRGPSIFGRRRPRTAEQWLVRGIVEYLQNEHPAARLSLRVALQRDALRARRWLDVLGVRRHDRKRTLDEAEVAPDLPDEDT